MNTLVTKLAPKATGMIRMDHTHVLATFHQYRGDLAPQTKRALVNTICLALEVHAQLEEELFYPAMREASELDDAAVDKSYPEHAEMKRLIAKLRTMEPGSHAYDETLYELMRDVMHHVADEETTLLPDAERLLGDDRLSELGARMTRRRLELTAPHGKEIALNTVRAMPASKMLMIAGAVVAGTWVTQRAFGSSSHARSH